MYGRPGFPPYPPNYPGMRPPYPFPGGERFRGPMPPRHPMATGSAGNAVPDERESLIKKVAIIKDKDLKEFDNILSKESKDGLWAAADGEVDYNEKLVFSDDEDQPEELVIHLYIL